MSALRLLVVFLRIGALNELAYRSNFLLHTFETLMSLGTALAAVFLVFRQTDELAGWSQYELLALLGIYYLVLGLIDLVVAPSLSRFMEDVRLGKLDYTLVKPADAQLLVSVSEFQLFKLGEVMLGAGLLIYSMAHLAEQVSAVDALVFGVALAAGGAIVYSFWLILATLSFWFIRVENLMMIFWNMYVAGRWPIGIYPGWLRFTLTALVPIAFAVTVPAEAVRGRLSALALLGAVALALVFIVFSRWFWRHGLRHYSGASA